MLFVPKLQGHKIKWFTVNQSVQYTIRNSSRKTYQQDGAITIFECSLRHSCLEIEWSPRSETDFISRIIALMTGGWTQLYLYIVTFVGALTQLTFWPVVCPDGAHFAGFIHDWMPVHYNKAFFTMGRSGNSIGNALDEDTDFTKRPRSFKTGIYVHTAVSLLRLVYMCTLQWCGAQ